MRVLSVTLVYPNPVEPGLGLFVRARLQRLTDHAAATVKIISPVPMTDYTNPRGKWFRGRDVPSALWDGPIEVLHPRWLYPPFGTPLNVLCLFLRLLWPIARLRQKFRFDLIDAHFGYPEGAATALLAAVFRVPFTVTLRGSELMFANYRWRRWCMRRALTRASAVITVSNELRSFAIGLGVDPARVKTIPNGIDSQVYYPRRQSECRASFDLAPNAKVVVCAGELIEAKGHHLVIRAVKQIIDSGCPVKLLIAGGVARGGARFDKDIRDLVRELALEESVQLRGWVNPQTMAGLMNAADVFCLASFTEGWPNVVNEALACGTPVVATSVGAVPQMLPKPDYGSIVPPRNQEALAGALRLALDRSWDRAAIAEWGQSRSWDAVAREVIEALQAAVKSEKPAARHNEVIHVRN